MNKQAVFFLSLWAVVLAALSMLIPGLLVDKSGSGTDGRGGLAHRWEAMPGTGESDGGQAGIGSSYIIPVYLTDEKRVERVPLEAYVRGVLAAEMPPDFEMEALKAQAIAARTYIVRRIVRQDFSNVPTEKAWITDSVVHQAYLTPEDMRRNWGTLRFAANWNKLSEAVRETRGQILTYRGEPIQAAFFSTSNGYTENSEDYWSERIPYLRSVPSPWDRTLSPKYRQTMRFKLLDVYSKLGVQAVEASTEEGVQLLERTEGGRVKTARVGGKEFTGREIREALDLPSSHFEFDRVGDEWKITTYGYGHGVGMSQYGAQGMALEGKKAGEILKYYYQGVRIERIEDLRIPYPAAGTSGLKDS